MFRTASRASEWDVTLAADASPERSSLAGTVRRDTTHRVERGKQCPARAYTFAASP